MAEETMNKGLRVSVSMTCNGSAMSAVFEKHSGRLRVFDNREVKAEWLPPNSWFALASVAGTRLWGTNPTEEDLRLFIEDFAGRPVDG
jgi:hypothetical protein